MFASSQMSHVTGGSRSPEQLRKDRTTAIVIVALMMVGVIVLTVLSAMGILPESGTGPLDYWMMP